MRPSSRAKSTTQAVCTPPPATSWNGYACERPSVVRSPASADHRSRAAPVSAGARCPPAAGTGSDQALGRRGTRCPRGQGAPVLPRHRLGGAVAPRGRDHLPPAAGPCPWPRPRPYAGAHRTLTGAGEGGDGRIPGHATSVTRATRPTLIPSSRASQHRSRPCKTRSVRPTRKTFRAFRTWLTGRSRAPSRPCEPAAPLDMS